MHTDLTISNIQKIFLITAISFKGINKNTMPDVSDISNVKISY